MLHAPRIWGSQKLWPGVAGFGLQTPACCGTWQETARRRGRGGARTTNPGMPWDSDATIQWEVTCEYRTGHAPGAEPRFASRALTLKEPSNSSLILRSSRP